MKQNTLDNHIRELAQARQSYEKVKAALDAERAAWEAQHADLIARVTAAKKTVAAAEETVRETARQAYESSDGTKQVHPAVEIKLFEVGIFDDAAAEAWARQHMPGLLVFDARAYEKVLREVKKSKLLAGVFATMPGQVITDAKPTIKRDLSTYLVSAEEVAS